MASDVSMQNDTDGTVGPIDVRIQRVALSTLDAILNAVPSGNTGYGEAADTVHGLAVNVRTEARELTASTAR